MKILKLNDLSEFSIAQFVNDCLSKRCPASFLDYFKYKTSQYHTRQEHQLEIPRSRLKIGQSRVECKGAKLFNSFDNPIAFQTNRYKFRQIMMSHYISKYHTANGN